MDGKDGVWRTIRGRRVFIGKGESLGQAMSKSGKFSRDDVRVGKHQAKHENLEKKFLFTKRKGKTKKEQDLDFQNKGQKYRAEWSKDYPSYNEPNRQAPKNRIVENGRINEQGKTRVERNFGRYSAEQARELKHENLQKKLADYNYAKANEDLEKNSKEWENRFNQGYNKYDDLDKERKDARNRFETARIKGNIDTQEKSDKIIADYKAKKQSNNKITQGEPLKDLADERIKEKQNTLANDKAMVEGMKRKGLKEVGGFTQKDYENRIKKNEDYLKQSNNKQETMNNRDAKDLFKQLNDEGSDFSFDDDVEIKDGKIKTSVGVFMPDDRGYTTRDVEIPIDKNETYASLENKLRDWQDRHSSPDTFYDDDFGSKKAEYEEKFGKTTGKEKIKELKAKKKGKNDWLPKATKIKEQGKSNRKEVSENIQAHILEHFDSPKAFVEQMDAYDHLPTNWHRGQEMAKDGFFSIYYDDQRKFLDDLKINPKGKNFNDDRVFQTYTSLIGRESAKLYDRIKKHEQDTIKNYKKKKGK